MNSSIEQKNTALERTTAFAFDCTEPFDQWPPILLDDSKASEDDAHARRYSKISPNDSLSVSGHSISRRNLQTRSET